MKTKFSNLKNFKTDANDYISAYRTGNLLSGIGKETQEERGALSKP